MMKTLTAVAAATILILVPGCKSSSKTSSSPPPVAYRLAAPQALQASDGTYPVGKCVPVEVEAMDFSGNIVASPIDATVGLAISDVSTTVTGAGIYSDNACKTSVGSVVVPRSADGVSPSLARVYVTSPTEGVLRLQADWTAGRSWIPLNWK